MKLFGKSRTQHETINIDRIKVARAVFQGTEFKDRLDLTVRLESGEILTFDMPMELAQVLITEVTSAYEASAPPLRRSNPAADWAGQDY